MAINKISGNILSDALIRGADLSFQTADLNDLLYLDIINGNVGINTAVATHTLTVNGNCNIGDTLEAGNLETPGAVTAAGNVSGDVGVFNDIIVGNIDIGNIIGGGNLQVESLTSNTFVTATGNVSGNIGIFNDIIVGNIDLGNLIAGGNLQVESLTSNTFVTATGNVTGGNLATAGTVSGSSGDFAGNLAAGNVSASGEITATGNITGGNISTPGDIVAQGNITAANFSGTGNISLGNLTIANTTISTSLAQGNITLTPTGDQLAVIDTVTGLVVPVGNSDQRPSGPPTGTLRFNTNIARLEIYDGADWNPVVSDVTNQTLNGDGSSLIFALDKDSTTAATLIMLNGVVQLPTTAYTVAANVLTFVQAPESTDVIDVRFL